MKKSLFFFSLLAMLFFNSSCKEELPISSTGSKSLNYKSSSPHSLYAHLTRPEDKRTFIPVENFDPYEDAIAEQTIERQESGFQELMIDNIHFKSVGLDLSGTAKDLLESCELIAYPFGVPSMDYVLATYDPTASNFTDNFQLEINPEEFTQVLKANRSLVYYFRLEFKEEPPIQDPSFIQVRYNMSVNYDYTILPNPEK